MPISWLPNYGNISAYCVNTHSNLMQPLLYYYNLPVMEMAGQWPATLLIGKKERHISSLFNCLLNFRMDTCAISIDAIIFRGFRVVSTHYVAAPWRLAKVSGFYSVYYLFIRKRCKKNAVK